MSNIEETQRVGPSVPLPNKQPQETKSGEITEKVGREHLISGPTKHPSIEQARVSSTTFESYLLNQVEILATFPIQHVEAARLGADLEKGLRAFEKGNPFHFISKNGESISIQREEKASFVQNYLRLLSTLLQKSEGSPQLKNFFYDLLKSFVKSNAFRSTNPNWEQRQAETLSKETLEQAFQQNPSLDNLASLILISQDSFPSVQPE